MQINDSSQATSLFPSGTKSARSLVRNFSDGDMTLVPEKTEEEIRLESSPLPVQKPLSPEEENRVLFLTNLLTQLLDIADGQPSEEQKARIRDIEKELEKITGVKRRSSLAAATQQMPGRKKDKDEEDDSTDIDGIDPEEAVHMKEPEYDKPTSPGMQMLQRQAAFFSVSSSLDFSNLKRVSKTSS